MKFYKLILAVLLSVLVFMPTYSYAEMKVGIVNLSRLLNEVPMYAEAREKIKKQFDPRARNLKTLEKEWSTLNDKYLKNEAVMSDSEKKSLVEKIQNIESKFRTGQEKLQVDLEQTQRSEFSKIEKIVNDAITEYAESNNFDIILRADGTTLYAKKYINVTEDIISKLQ
tara:strand:- start:7 stop:513 length:507 start_codon:yes stop_codon:yes gene_type:complete